MKTASKHLSTFWLLVIQFYTSWLSSSSFKLTKFCFYVSFFHRLTQFYQVKASINKAKSIPVCLYVSKPKHLALILAKLWRFYQQNLQSVANNLSKSLFTNRRLIIVEPFQHRRLVSCQSLFFERVLLNLLK